MAENGGIFEQYYFRITLLLQAFLREADQIDSVTASHEAFLEFDDLGVRFPFALYLYSVDILLC